MIHSLTERIIRELEDRDNLLIALPLLFIVKSGSKTFRALTACVRTYECARIPLHLSIYLPAYLYETISSTYTPNTTPFLYLAVYTQ